MGNSLFDQLNKTGLVDKNKAKQTRKEKHRQAKLQKGKQTRPQDESTLRAQQIRAEQVARDRELNQQRKQAAERKAIAAQIKQLIEMNRIEDTDGDIGFNFTDDKKVQQLYVTEQLQEQLVRGRLAIVRMDGRYDLVPAGVAEKIKQRDSSYVMLCNVISSDTSSADDPYADYQVPDDLMW